MLVGSFQTIYSFSRFLTLSSIIQMDTANTQPVSANFRLRWKVPSPIAICTLFTQRTRASPAWWQKPRNSTRTDSPSTSLPHGP